MPETVTSVFPDHLVQWGLISGIRNQTDILEAQGREQRRPLLPAPGRRLMRADLEPLGMTARGQVANYLLSRRGMYLPFYLFQWDPQIYKSDAYGNQRLGAPALGANYLIGPGNGTNTLFTLPMGNPVAKPGLATTLQAAYANSTQFPASIVVGTGTYGEDKLQFVSAAPGPTIAAVLGAGSLSTGNYQMAVSFVISGHESFFGAGNTVAAASGDALGVSAIPLGPAGTTARKLYRTVANGAVMKFDQTIADNVTTVAVSSQADGSLGATGPGVGPAIGAVIEADITGRLRVPVRLTSDDVIEAFMVSAQILGLRHIDAIEVL